MREAEIIATDDGFAIVADGRADRIAFDRIRSLIVYKLDLLTTDLICCDVATDHAEGGRIRTIHEDMPGFDAVMASLAILPGFDRRWRNEVVLPPFAASRTTIYRRDAEFG